MKILVIGGAGYIGSALIPKLLKQKHKVTLLDCFLYGKHSIENFRDAIEVISSDFRDYNRVEAAIKQVDAVIHLGAIVGDQACDLDPSLTYQVNTIAPLKIASIANKHKIQRFLFSSTCSVYGANKELLTEESSLNPVSLYAESKIAAEQELLMLYPHITIIPRFGTVYGFSGRTRFDLVVNLLTAKAKFDGEITIFGGNQWRPFLHVDDAAQAIYQLITAKNTTGEIFNIGSNLQNYKIIDVGYKIKEAVPDAILKTFDNDHDTRNYRVSFLKIKNKVGYRPRWKLEDGINQVISSIELGKITNYKRAKYSNLKYLRDKNALKKLQNFVGVTI